MTRHATGTTPAWATALEEYAGAHPDTAGAAARARATRLRRLAVDLGGDPATTGHDQVRAWLDGLDCSPEARRKYRHAARAFFGWAQQAGLRADNPVLAPVRASVDERWRDALGQFARAQQGAGIADATISIRVGQMRRFARETRLAPWEPTHDDIAAWVATVDAADGTRRKLRDSLRAFYRWAHARGRVDSDPTAEPARRATTPHVPEPWQEPIRSWRSWLRSAGHPETTVHLRLTQIRHLARDHASRDPFTLTLDDLIEWLAGKRWGAETRKSHRSALRSFYGWAAGAGRIVADPSERLPAVRMAQPQPRPAMEEDYRAALRAADVSDRLAVRLAAELGLRCAEVARVHSRDIRSTAGVWTLLVHGKGQKQRTLPLPESLANLIRSHDGYAFPGNDNGHVSPVWLSRRVSRLLPEGVTMHALRHRFATMAYNIDRDVFSVQRLLGHSSPATTQRYVLVNDDALRRLVDQVASDS